MINLWQLHVFLEVSETGSFSAAAARLHMTQPGVSQQIRALEGHLGTQLFVRRGHGVELTPAGFDLLDPARRMINLSEVTERTLMSRRGEVSGRIRLGCALTSAPYITNGWLYEFRSRHPDVTVQMEYTEPGPLIGSLRAQELDGGFVLGRNARARAGASQSDGGPYHLDRAPQSRLDVACRIGRAEMEYSARTDTKDGHEAQPGTPLPIGYSAVRTPRHEEEGWVPAIKPAMLKDQPMVLEHGIGESHSDARRALNDALEERSLSTRDLRIVLEVPDPAGVACAVAEGIGIGLVPQSMARRFVGQVVSVRIEGFVLTQHVYLVRDRKALNSPAVSAWWKFVESKAGQHTEDKPEQDNMNGDHSKSTQPQLPLGQRTKEIAAKRAVATTAR